MTLRKRRRIHYMHVQPLLLLIALFGLAQGDENEGADAPAVPIFGATEDTCANSIDFLCEDDDDCCDVESQVCLRGRCQPRYPYRVELLGSKHNGGAVIAHEYDNPDFDEELTEVVRSGRTHFPCVVAVPEWVPRRRRAHPRARYYLYYGKNGGIPSSKQIFLKWARHVGGPWHRFDLGYSGGLWRRGVLDFGDDAECQQCSNQPDDYPNLDIDSKRNGYRLVTAPDVIVDEQNRRFILFYYAQTQPPINASAAVRQAFVPQNMTFVSFSEDGLNFNDPETGGGQPGFGPRQQTVLLPPSEPDSPPEAVTHDIAISRPFHRTFFVRNRLYAITERGTLFRPNVDSDDAIFSLQDDLFVDYNTSPRTPRRSAWKRQSKPSPFYNKTFSGNEYKSAIADFFASDEFVWHPNNENFDDYDGGRFASRSGQERVARPAVSVLEDQNQLEVFFWIADDPNDRYPDLYRVLLDVSSDNFDDWQLVRDPTSGHVIFDTVLRPAEIHRQVRSSNRARFNAKDHADPRSFGDSYILTLDNNGDEHKDAEKFLFFTYVSQKFRGLDGDGQISSVELKRTRKR